ncbi:hypothetical protein DCAR_0206950 [Daucus carota subsp. sativus]|uniref:FAF domain-containing protein n=1 Tax=Daucus carota subsp. sativus TaxID=79200 RepID=A0AAF1ALM0_DAUCS|nr:hypothetical protein DCAR_0206950 [Daucus carota subsp. sativus]
MAACESLEHIYDKPLPLKNHQIPLQVSVSLVDDSSSSLSPLSSSFSPSSSPFSSSSSYSSFPVRTPLSMCSDSLSICTKNLGLESNDVEIPVISGNNDFRRQVIPRRKIGRHMRHRSNEVLYDSKGTFNAYMSSGEPRISRITGERMPPPISTIAGNGKPWVCFKSFRNDGRLVLREARIPTKELLQSRREEGRLKLQYVQSDEETMD